MYLSPSVWSAAVRNLTGFGSGALVMSSVANTALAANATAAFTPVATRVQINALAAAADASGSVVIQLTDTTNTWTAVTVAAGTTGGQDNALSNNLTFWQIHNNSATVAAHYFVSGYTLVQ